MQFFLFIFSAVSALKMTRSADFQRTSQPSPPSSIHFFFYYRGKLIHCSTLVISHCGQANSELVRISSISLFSVLDQTKRSSFVADSAFTCHSDRLMAKLVCSSVEPAVTSFENDPPESRLFQSVETLSSALTTCQPTRPGISHQLFIV